MSYGSKPIPPKVSLKVNDLGLTSRDYEGSLSTLCAGCGHDSITAAIIQALHELSILPENVVKVSGIGCSSKTPTYFVEGAHGFNAVHGRMPSVSTGAYGVNGNLKYIGVSGDGDSLSIGLGQFVHVIRRNINMLYIIENNGVYGLTKGQFSASADIGSTTKRGLSNELAPIDPALIAITLGAGLVARAFSGDKEQLVPILKASLCYPGFALIDIISPCVTFNDHTGSTKSYLHTREKGSEAIHMDYVEPKEEIKVSYKPSETISVDMHNGAKVLLNKVNDSYDPTDPIKAYEYIRRKQSAKTVVTGLLYINEDMKDMHEALNISDEPLNTMDCRKLIPSRQILDHIFDSYR